MKRKFYSISKRYDTFERSTVPSQEILWSLTQWMLPLTFADRSTQFPVSSRFLSYAVSRNHETDKRASFFSSSAILRNTYTIYHGWLLRSFRQFSRLEIATLIANEGLELSQVAVTRVLHHVAPRFAPRCTSCRDSRGNAVVRICGSLHTFAKASRFLKLACVPIAVVRRGKAENRGRQKPGAGFFLSSLRILNDK